MTWSRIGQCISGALSLALVLRLFILRLHSVYRAFWIFLLWECFSSFITLYSAFSVHHPDYRYIYLVLRLVAWILSLWMVYALLTKILIKFKGILEFSRKLLKFTFGAAIGVGFLTAIPEYLVSGTAGLSTRIDRAVGFAFVFDRVISTVALLALLAILGFILWFPVKMPRNLAVFSIGFVIYFASKTALWLVRSYWSHESLDLVSDTINTILSACFAYWIIFVVPQGEIAPFVGHSWQAEKQRRLLSQLEAINAALLRSARR